MANEMWTEVFKRLPWVTYLKKGQQCMATKSGAPLKLYHQGRGLQKLTEAEHEALRVKYSCKNSAHWKFRALRRSYFPCRSGVYCWSHFLHRGLFGSMDEEARVLRWFKRHDPDIHERLRPRECADV